MSENETTTTAKKTVVLVHGAFADGSCWEKVIPILLAKDLNVVAVQNPLTSLADDAAAAKRTIDAVKGEVILVGHSWGGTVITQAGTDEKISALVYVAAFAPSKGETTNDPQKDYPQPAWLEFANVDQAGFAGLTDKGMSEFFAQDLPAAQTAVMTVTQGTTALSAFGDPLTEEAWSAKPAWYIVAENDRMIYPDMEKAFAKKMNAKTTFLPSSHVVMLSHPEEVAAVILEAAGLS